ncbi:MAG: NAD(P)/FAD-dependent oxidoreductase [Phycisphaerae bacterium]
MTSGNSKTCAIVGAGLTGLTAGRQLVECGHRVTLFEKGYHPGGRAASKRVGDALCDTGAQFFTVRRKLFADIAGKWLDEGAVCEWARGFSQDGSRPEQDGHPRYRGTEGMRGLAAHLAGGLDLQLRTKVRKVQADRRNARVMLEGETAFPADVILLTPPVPQSLELLQRGAAPVAAHQAGPLKGLVYEKCIAIAARLDGLSHIPKPGGVQFSDGDISWLADNRIKGISRLPGITLHASVDYSERHWLAGDSVVAGHLLGEVRDLVGSPIEEWILHRWRYSKPVGTFSQRCLKLAGLPVILAGDAFAGPRVEGAVLSGLAAASEAARLLAE